MNTYLAIMNPTAEEALTLHRIADRVFRVFYNVHGVKVTKWNRDKVEFLFHTEGIQLATSDNLAALTAREFYRQGGDENADISWGPEPQEYRNGDYWDVSPEDYREWIAASCGEC